MQNRRVAVRGIVLRDDKILGVRLKNYKGRATDDGKRYWCTPGGGVDVGEPLLQALEREIIEEVGVRPVIGNLLYVQQFQYEDAEHLEFFYHILNHDDYTSIQLENTSHGAIEIAEANFIDPAAVTLLPVFLTETNIPQDVSIGATKYFNYLLS